MRAASAFSTSTKIPTPCRIPFFFLVFGLLILLPFDPRASEPADYGVLKKLMTEGAYETALSQGEAYLKAYPDSPRRRRVAGWVGHMLLDKGQAKAALPFLEEAADGAAPEERGKFLLLQARALLDLNEAAKAAAVVQGAAVEGSPQRVEALGLLADARSRMGDPEAAASAIHSIPEAERTTRDRYILGMALVRMGRDNDGMDVLSACIEEGKLSEEETREARLALGASCYRLRRYDRGLQILAPLTGRAHPDTQALLLEAWILHAQGREAEAYDLARKAVPLVGWREAAALLPVRMAAAECDQGGVVSAAAEIVKRFPKGEAAARARLLAARALAERGDTATGLHVLEAALPELPKGPDLVKTGLFGAELAWRKLRDPARADRWLAVAKKAAQTEEEKARVSLAKARLAWERGDSDQSVRELATLVTVHKGAAAVPDAYLLLGRILIAEGTVAKGREALRVVVEAFPDSHLFPEAVLALGESKVAEGADEELEPLLALLADVALEPGQEARRAVLAARLALAREEWPEAEAAFARSTSFPRDENRDEALFGIALAYLGAGAPNRAMDEAGAITRRELRDAVAFRAAEILLAKKGKAEATSILEKLSAENGPDAPLALWSLADLRLSAGEKTAGLATLKRLAALPESESLSVLAQRRLEMVLLMDRGPGAALKVVPGFRRAEPLSLGEAEALLRSARLEADLGHRKASAAKYATYLERLPDGPGAREAALVVALYAMEENDFTKARRTLEKAPPSPGLDLALGRACYALRDMAAAESALERALSHPGDLSPEERTQACFLAGTAARIQGKTGAAVPHLEAYARSAPAVPANRDALFDAALWLQNRGRYEAALAALAKLRKAFRDAAVGYNYAYTLELMGRPDDALGAYLKVAYRSANPQWALTARYRAAELMAAMGRRKDAIALYQRLAERTEGTVQGDYARKRLLQLQQTPSAQKPEGNRPGENDHEASPTAH